METNITLPQANVTAKASALQGEKNKKQVHEAAVKFEAMYMNEMLSHMFEGVDVANGPMGGGHGEKIFQSMMVEQYGTMIAKSGQTGISANIEREMLKMQEEQLKGGRQ